MLVLGKNSDLYEILEAKMNRKYCALREDTIDWKPKSESAVNDKKINKIG